MVIENELTVKAMELLYLFMATTVFFACKKVFKEYPWEEE